MGLAVSCRCGGSGAPEFGSWSRSATAGAVGIGGSPAATGSLLRMRAGLLPLGYAGCANLTDSGAQCTSVAPRRRDLRPRRGYRPLTGRAGRGGGPRFIVLEEA